MPSTPRTPGRREQIVAAAVALVEEGGVGAVSVRTVAEQAGIGASTLRHYFPRQKDLNVAVASRLLSRQLDDHRIGDTSVDPATRLLECLSQFLAPDDDRHLLVGWLDLQHRAITEGEDSLSAQLLTGFDETSRDRVRAWLEQLAAEGHLAAGEVERGATSLSVRVDGLSLAMLHLTRPMARASAQQILADDIDRLLTP